MEKAATAATYTGAGSAVFFGLTANEFAAVSGVVIALVGLLVNIWFKHQHLQIAKKKGVAGDE
ncbi:MAG: HP1 family phage holin [Burkholderiaceae bacterium]|nr:HP1 family phage holin [Burkholderiaceae bacterium]